MEQNHNGHLNFMLSIITGSVAWIQSIDVDTVVRTGSGMVSIVAGLFAIRHYYYSTKKTKEQLKED